jgi:hypothetical protein
MGDLLLLLLVPRPRPIDQLAAGLADGLFYLALQGVMLKLYFDLLTAVGVLDGNAADTEDLFTFGHE